MPMNLAELFPDKKFVQQAVAQITWEQTVMLSDIVPDQRDIFQMKK